MTSEEVSALRKVIHEEVTNRVENCKTNDDILGAITAYVGSVARVIYHFASNDAQRTALAATAAEMLKQVANAPMGEHSKNRKH